METETLRKSRMGTRYGPGIAVRNISGHRVLKHGDEVFGFSAENLLFPDDGIAVAVLTNQDSSAAPSAVAHKIASLLVPESGDALKEILERMQAIFSGMQKGQIDRSQFCANGNGYFTGLALRDFQSSTAPLGTPLSFVAGGWQSRGGMTYRDFVIQFPRKKLRNWICILPDGKIEQYQEMKGL
jgi:D-alanyl-D-alanine carboxypeptidase